MVLHNVITTGAGYSCLYRFIRQMETVPEEEMALVRPLSVLYGYRMVL